MQCVPTTGGWLHSHRLSLQGEEDTEVARHAALELRASEGDVAAKKALKKENDKFAESYYQFAKYKRLLMWMGINKSTVCWRQDVMHGINLNIAKADFKYCWLDGASGARSFHRACALHRDRARSCAFEKRGLFYSGVL